MSAHEDDASSSSACVGDDVIDVPVESLRRTRVRAKTISIKRLSPREIAAGKLERMRDEIETGHVQRPRTRGDCVDGPRPCPWVSCKHSLYLDVGQGNAQGKGHGAIKLNFPHLEPGEMRDSCALDVADRGGVILDEVAVALNLTRERTRQLELLALQSLPRPRALREIWEADTDRPDSDVCLPPEESSWKPSRGIVILDPRVRAKIRSACQRALDAGRALVLMPVPVTFVRLRLGRKVRLWAGGPQGRYVAPSGGIFDAAEILAALAGGRR